MIGLGNALYDMGEPRQAIEYYNKALEIDQKLADVHYNLGNALYLIEDTEIAIEHYQMAI